MTEQEAIKFVTEEIRGRNPKVTDAQCVDWMAVVRGCDATKARQIVQQIATDPDEQFLTPKAFNKRIRAEQAQSNPGGKFRYGYAVNEPFQVWIVKQSDWKVRIPLSYPTRRIYDNGTVQAIDWTWERLHDAMLPYLQRHQHQYGGDWVLEIKEPAPEPSVAELVKMRGDRIVARLAAALPKVEMPKKPAPPTRAMLEEIGRDEPGATEPDDPKPLPTGHIELTGELPEADAEFFKRESELLKGKE